MSAPYHCNPWQHDASLPGKNGQSFDSPSYYDGSEQQGYYPPQGLYGQHQQQQGYHSYPPAPYSTPQDQQKQLSYSGNPYTYLQSGYATAYGVAPSHPQPEQPGNQGYYDQNPQSQAVYPRNAGSASYYPPQQQPYQSAGPSHYGPSNEANPQMGQSIVRPPPPPPNGGKKGKGSKMPNMPGGGIGHGLLGAAGGALAGVAGMGLVGKLRKKRRNHKYGHQRGSSSGSGSCSGSSSGSSSGSDSSSGSATSDCSSSNSN